MTLSLMMIGAPVSVSPVVGLASTARHTSLPVTASTAMVVPSSTL